MRTIMLAAALAVLLGPAWALAAGSPAPGVRTHAAGTPPPARTVKPTHHPRARRERHCLVSHVRVREGGGWVTHTRRSCR
jgi:hypothetical protein